jgi:fluoroquinolone resistance protein
MKNEEPVEHEGKLFEKIDFREKTVEGRKFMECTFKNCQLNMLVFKDCTFTDCIFDSCDLSLIKVKGSFFNRIQIIGCKAIGIHWFDTGSPFAINFTDSNISYSSFFGKALKKAKIKNCVAKEVDFSDTNLTEADFNGTDLENSRFSNCDLSLANFKEARNYSVDLVHNKMRKTKFSLPEALSLLNQFDIVIE